MVLIGSKKALLLIVFLVAHAKQNAHGFTTLPLFASRHHQQVLPKVETRTIQTNQKGSTFVPHHYSSIIRLHAEKPNPNLLEGYDQRGNILFAVVFLAIIWSFSIPPELRREHFCFSRNCRLDNTGKACYNCISIQEWFSKVSDYYKGGGGVHFDFSIEEKTD